MIGAEHRDDVRLGTWVVSPELKYRREYFGCLLWTRYPTKILKLSCADTAVWLMHLKPRTSELDAAAAAAMERWLALPSSDFAVIQCRLASEGLLARSPDRFEPIRVDEVQQVAGYLASYPERHVTKPFWVHLQPFTRCNQKCLHCYCNGGPRGDPFLLPLRDWQSVIRRLDLYGIFDIYITGGETLLYDDAFRLIEEIAARKLGCGISTNASFVTDEHVERLWASGIEKVQVSLDGAVASTHDAIRGVAGAFDKTLAGIAEIARRCMPVINTVVNRRNVAEIEGIVRIGISLGCREFKFFPQKLAGRALSYPESLLSDHEIADVFLPWIDQLRAMYAVEIETIDANRPCGSAKSGFAIDQEGNIYPCIFGINNPHLRCGNILQDDLDEIWFESPVFASFRNDVPCSGICHRCEGM